MLKAVKTFSGDRSGSVAIMFGLMIVMLAGCIALALDYARALAVRSQLQTAADAAALAANPVDTDTDADLLARVTVHFNYNMPTARSNATGVTVASAAITDGVRVTAQANVPTTFGRLLGIANLPVQVVSEAKAAKNAFEIAMVLDNTYSMSGSKLADLKVAAKSLVDQVIAGSTPGSVKFSLVPFSNYVNIGKSYRGSIWLSVPNDYSETKNVCWWNQAWKNCRTSNSTCYNDGVPYSCTQTFCDPDGAPVQQCGDQTHDYVWNGCAGSRMPQDLSAPVSGASPVPGILDVGCPSALTRLTTDDAAIKGQIDGMIAQGETYIPAGLMWGWRALSTDLPFADAAAANATPKTRKVMILMTDGDNTKSQIDANHEGSDAAAANATMSQLCANIKSQNIELYSIAFTVTNPDAKTLLQTCATSSAHFYDAADSAALQTAFSRIAGSLQRLALTH